MFKPGDAPIPGYRLVRFIGHGAYGEVWESQAPGGARAALKFISLQSSAGGIELKSANAVKLIRHANLVPITAIWVLDRDGNVLDDQALESIDQAVHPHSTLNADRLKQKQELAYLVIGMSLADECLDSKFERYRETGSPGIPRDELLEYMRDAAKGLDYLNEPVHLVDGQRVGIVHRDVKPANLLLLGDSVVVGDFGVATSLRDFDAQATRMVGSLAFMAPESLSRHPTPSGDQYALAITYYYLRTGEMPFGKGHTFDSLAQVHKEGRLEFDAVPEPERIILKRATAVPPNPRYPNCAGFVAALSAACQACETESRSLTSRLWPAVVALVTLGMIGWIAWPWLNPKDSPVEPPPTPIRRSLAFTPSETDFDMQYVSAPDAQSTRREPIKGTGTAIFELNPGEKIQIRAHTESPVYFSIDETFDYQQLKEMNWQLRLKQKTVAELRQQAFQMITDKKWDEAIELLNSAARELPAVLDLPSPISSPLELNITELHAGSEEYVVTAIDDTKKTVFRFGKPKLAWFNRADATNQVSSSPITDSRNTDWNATEFSRVQNVFPRNEPDHWLVIMTDSIGEIANDGTSYQRWNADDDARLLFSTAAVSTDGQWLACGDFSGAIHLWSVAMDGSLNSYQVYPAHQASVFRMNFVGDENNLLSLATDRTGVRLTVASDDLKWNITPLKTPDLIKQQELVGATLAPNGRLILATEERLWTIESDADSIQPLGPDQLGPDQLGPDQSGPNQFGGLISIVRSSPRSAWVLVGNDSVSHAVQLFNSKTSAIVFPDDTDFGSVAAVAFSANGQWLAISSYSGKMYLVDLSGDAPVWRTLPKSNNGYRKFLAFTSTSEYLVSIDDTGLEEIWPIERCQLIFLARASSAVMN